MSQGVSRVWGFGLILSRYTYVRIWIISEENIEIQELKDETSILKEQVVYFIWEFQTHPKTGFL